MQGTDERRVLIILTVASLSQKNRIFFLAQCLPQRMHATTIGYSSSRAVEESPAGKESNSTGQAHANHSFLKTPPNPTEGAASVYKSRATDDSIKSLRKKETPFHLSRSRDQNRSSDLQPASKVTRSERALADLERSRSLEINDLP